MTFEDFKKLPELLTRAQVVECGVPASAVDDLRVLLTAQEERAPWGKIGAIQLPGRSCKNVKKAKFKYRKTDVARIVGYKV